MREKMIFIITLICMIIAVIELVKLYINKRKLYILITIAYAVMLVILKTPFISITGIYKNILTVIAIILLIPFFYSYKAK